MRDGRARHTGLVAAVVVGIVASGAMVVPASAKTKVNMTLSPTAKAPSAKGQARLQLKTGSSGKFSVKGKHLKPNATFDVVVNKIKVGTLTTGAGGSGVAKFTTNGRGSNQVLGFDPQGDDVEVRDDNGDDDLEGEMPDDNPDSAVGCCLGQDRHDEGEVECENMTPAECSEHGGTPAAGGCLPDPCGGTPPPGGVVCCSAHSEDGAEIDDDPEVECENEGEGDCAEHGGTLVKADSCDPNPCQPVPPPSVVICCVPDDDGSECEQLTQDHCSARGGSVSSATSCSNNPCGTGGGGDGGGGGGGDGGGDDGGGDDHHGGSGPD